MEARRVACVSGCARVYDMRSLFGNEGKGGAVVLTCVRHGAPLSQLHPSHSCKCVYTCCAVPSAVLTRGAAVSAQCSIAGQGLRTTSGSACPGQPGRWRHPGVSSTAAQQGTASQQGIRHVSNHDLSAALVKSCLHHPPRHPTQGLAAAVHPPLTNAPSSMHSRWLR
jgi:hypothetical protein